MNGPDIQELAQIVWERTMYFYSIYRNNQELSCRYDDIKRLGNGMIKWCQDFPLNLSLIRMEKEDFESQTNFVLYMKALIIKYMCDINMCFERLVADVDWFHANVTTVDQDLFDEWDKTASEIQARHELLRDMFLCFQRVHTMFKEMVDNRHYADPEEYKFLKSCVLKLGIAEIEDSLYTSLC